MVSVFIRKFEINSCGKSLTFCRKKVGDVSCVVWDATLVLAKYLEAMRRLASRLISFRTG
jgi:hypothetical protein